MQRVEKCKSASLKATNYEMRTLSKHAYRCNLSGRYGKKVEPTSIITEVANAPNFLKTF